MNLETIENRLSNIEKNLLISTKEVLTLDEVSIYTGLSKSHVYKLCSSNTIPFYKPHGKINYFNRQEIQNWLQQNRVSTKVELDYKASEVCTNLLTKKTR